MEFENARKGIKRIFMAEIMSLLALVCGFAAAFAQQLVNNEGIPASGTINLDPSSPVIMGLSVAVLALSLLSLIMHLTGISRASKDEPKFKKAMLWVVIGIVLGSINSSLHLEEAVSTGVDMAKTLSELLVKCFIITGVMSVAEQMNRPGLKFLGNKALVWAVLAQIVSLGLKGVSVWYGLKGGNPMLADFIPAAAVMLVVSLVFDLIAYIVYLRFLKTAAQSLG
ncbi:MAG: hypothetical protein K6E41_04325 [Solobacterium sp.]|jgi:F0F1-type ATP synthase membrane subunit c/vacuolar-type H+-ATPase subunit K|nr:hypothetical protein [Solobacterium sp.]